MIPSYTYVSVSLYSNGSVAVIELNRPQSGNSLHPILLQDTLAAYRWANDDANIRVIIQTGAGKFYCTGMELLDDSPGKEMSFSHGSDFHQLNHLLITTPKILIAAVNGPAAGYGVSSLVLFDLIYCVPHAYFFTPFVKWGMAAEGSSSFSFPRLMGHQRAAALFLAGERIDAKEAQAVGLVNSILSPGELKKHSLEVAERMSNAPAGALLATKALMRAPVAQQLIDANDRECSLISQERYGSQEYKQAVRTFKIDQQKKRSLKSSL